MVQELLIIAGFGLAYAIRWPPLRKGNSTNNSSVGGEQVPWPSSQAARGPHGWTFVATGPLVAVLAVTTWKDVTSAIRLPVTFTQPTARCRLSVALVQRSSAMCRWAASWTCRGHAGESRIDRRQSTRQLLNDEFGSKRTVPRAFPISREIPGGHVWADIDFAAQRCVHACNQETRRGRSPETAGLVVAVCRLGCSRVATTINTPAASRAISHISTKVPTGQLLRHRASRASQPWTWHSTPYTPAPDPSGSRRLPAVNQDPIEPGRLLQDPQKQVSPVRYTRSITG
jgi:hypothetical protein